MYSVSRSRISNMTRLCFWIKNEASPTVITLSTVLFLMLACDQCKLLRFMLPYCLNVLRCFLVCQRFTPVLSDIPSESNNAGVAMYRESNLDIVHEKQSPFICTCVCPLNLHCNTSLQQHSTGNLLLLNLSF